MIIGLTGRKRSGKDTAAAVFEAAGFTNMKFATPLKLMLAALLEYQGVDDETIWRMLEGDLKEVPTPFLNGHTPRHAMQTLGTEWGRKLMGADIWTNIFSNAAAQHELVVVSDVRFPNELDAIWNLAGRVWRITRQTQVANDNHESEAFIDELPVDGEISNSAPTIEEFQEQVFTMLVAPIPRKRSKAQ